MIKRISAYTLHCDACGRRLGGPFGSRSTAFIFAIGNGLAKSEVASSRDAFVKSDQMDPETPGYRYVVCLTYDGRWYSPRVTWKDALAYQGSRPGIYLSYLRSISPVHFPLSDLGLSLAPQSYAYAKKLPPFERTF